MRYDIVHTTRYDYSDSVAVSHHMARLRPRDLPNQRCVRHELVVEPAAAVTSTHEDYFGNPVTFFAMQGAHKSLVVRARSTVEAFGSPPVVPPGMPWEAAAERSSLPLDVLEFVIASANETGTPGLDAYARVSFPDGRPLRDALIDLTARIHDDFTFDSGATTVATPLADVFKSRRGVCQDFARLEIACLRALGIPARYISGYLETVPPPGTERLLGADASHAWLTVHCPGAGWIHVDPTNNLLPSDTHITLAWGRDYDDVSPVRGVILGGGAHTLRVQVDVVRVEDDR
jgi:transglutaminase-like putative cysteine protease